MSEPDLNAEGFDTQAWPFYWLTRATGLYLSRLERSLKKIGLDIARWRVLMCVGPNQARSVSEIADLAIVKMPTMMKIIQRMQADGLVDCRPRTEDGRYTDVTLTDAGKVAREQVWQLAHKIYERAFANVTAPDSLALNIQLARIVDNLKD